jgi:hypothetical protein
VDEILGVEPSYTVQRIIESNGFQINREKIKIYSQNKRQTVTGIVVNEKVNCRRSYIRNLRGKLHALEKYGSDAEALYKSRYVKNSLLSSRHRGSLATHIQGKLAYLKMLKGPYDSVYRKLKHRYDTIIGKPSFYFENINDEISAGLWIIEYLKGEDCFQGTGFFVEGVGLVTCSHVVGDDTIAYRHDSTTNIHKVKVLYNDENRDVAILDIQGVNLQEKYCFSIRENDNLSVGDKIILAGFPEYAPGATPTIINTELSSFRTRSGVRKFQVAAGVYNGNSGGPVFDSNCKVIGIADRGDTASVSTAIHFSELKKCIAELRKKSQDGVDLLPQSTESTPPPPSLLPPQRD